MPAGRRVRFLLPCSLLLLIVACDTACGRSPDFREIVPGKVYVSAQPDPGELVDLIEVLRLRSLLNLRSENVARFSGEIELCRRMDVAYLAVELPLDAPTPRSVLVRIVKLLDTAETPLLVHCRNGVDRSGLVAAVALLLSDRGIEDAWKEMPFLSRWRAMHGGRPLARVLIDYGHFLAGRGVETSGELFRDWVDTGYCPVSWAARVELEGAPPRVLEAGGKCTLGVRVTNLGPDTWRPEADGPVLGLKLFYRNEDVYEDCGRSPLPRREIAPGETVRWTASFRLPGRPGSYLAAVDLLREHQHWFSEMGWPARVFPLLLLDRKDTGAFHERPAGRSGLSGS